MNPYLKIDLIEIGVDVERALKDYFLGNEDIFEKIIMQSLTTDDLIAETYAALDANDVERAFNATHKLKSQLGYFCFDVVNNNVKAACEIFRAKEMNGARELLDEVKDRYYAFMNILKKYAK